jgi:endo-1,4-beta-D-glucanase Y
MTKISWPRKKLLAIAAIALLYIILGATFKLLVDEGVIPRMATVVEANARNDTGPALDPHMVSERLAAAQSFFEQKVRRANGHIDLYWLAQNASFPGHDNTNSEAVSYYLLWTAQAKEKEAFDKELEFVQKKMVHPIGGYLQWRLTANDRIVTDGGNIASDADLRAIRALLIAEQQWGDGKYTAMIGQLARGLERSAITKDNLLAPYGGMSGDSPWAANESYLSYSDFAVFKELEQRRGNPWGTVYEKMKAATLGAQLQNGLYNSQLTQQRKYGNSIDGSGYSINSMWMMIRNAESNDSALVASAAKSLAFYKQQYGLNAELDPLYDSDGNALSPGDAPWVYALVGRAAVALGDTEFADAMVARLLEHQVTTCNSSLFGAIPEGSDSTLRVGQFTMQESILTLQAWLQSREERLPQAAAASNKAACVSS